MTGAKDPGINAQKWDLYQELLREGKLTVRMFALWSGSRDGQNADQVMARVLAQPKPPAALGDGVLLSGRREDVHGRQRRRAHGVDARRVAQGLRGVDAGNRGYPSIDPDAYRRIVFDLHNAGIHVSTHAIGDRAIDWVLDTYDLALKAKPTRGLRHGIIHENTPTDHAIDVTARLQRDFDAAYPESQAEFMWWIGDNYAGNFGPARVLRLKPFQTYMRKGIKWAGGSDYPVTPFPARYGLWASVARTTLHGTYGDDAVRRKRSGGHQDRAALLYGVGRAPAVSRRSRRHDRGRQRRRPRRLGSRSVHRADGSAEGDALRPHYLQRPHRLQTLAKPRSTKVLYRRLLQQRDGFGCRRGVEDAASRATPAISRRARCCSDRRSWRRRRWYASSHPTARAGRAGWPGWYEMLAYNEGPKFPNANGSSNACAAP